MSRGIDKVRTMNAIIDEVKNLEQAMIDESPQGTEKIRAIGEMIQRLDMIDHATTLFRQALGGDLQVEAKKLSKLPEIDLESHVTA